MLVLLHVSTALLSFILSTVCIFLPSKAKLMTSYGLVGATLATGLGLVISTKTSILQVCLSGLLYLSLVAVLLYFARSRLTRQT